MTPDKPVFTWSKLKFGENIDNDFANALHMVQIAGRKLKWNQWQTMRELLNGLLDMGWSKEKISDICLRRGVSEQVVIFMLGHDINGTFLEGRQEWIRDVKENTAIIRQ